MIDTKELRLGNYVYDSIHNKFPMRVVGIGEDWVYLDFEGNEGDLWDATPKELEPIEITKEVLKKAGFAPTDTCYHDKPLEDNKRMQYYKHESRLRVWYDNTDVIFECYGIRCLHQLQNAHYLATGHELDIKL